MKDSKNIQDLTGKVILVTGALGLIGKTICKGFLQSGANVVMADINASGFDQNELTDYPSSQYHFQQVDITDAESVRICVEVSLAKYGKIDVLVNNAAIDAKFDAENEGKVNQSRFENYPIDLLRKSMEVNLTGTIQMTQAVCRQMLKQKHGNIVNVASTYSLVAPNQSLYDYGTGIQQYKPVDYILTKSCIPNFTRYLATFYAGDNIRCNAIVPHGIENNHGAEFKENFSRLSPLGRMCEREELIGPFTFLASDASSYMTGSILTVDGGWTAW